MTTFIFLQQVSTSKGYFTFLEISVSDVKVNLKHMTEDNITNEGQIKMKKR